MGKEDAFPFFLVLEKRFDLQNNFCRVKYYPASNDDAAECDIVYGFGTMPCYITVKFTSLAVVSLKVCLFVFHNNTVSPFKKCFQRFFWVVDATG